MIRNHHDTAILIFSRPSDIEGKEKMLVRGNHLANKQSFEWLKNRTARLAQSSSLPYFLVQHQKGNTFGQRLANAFQEVFNRGYQRVIAIGNDCPDLSVYDLKKATGLLQNDQAVVGPDGRNGVYLIGLNAKQFNPNEIANLPWQTKHTFEALTAYLGTTTILETKHDLNDQLDLRQFIRSAVRSIRRTFYLLIRSIGNWLQVNNDSKDQNLILTQLRRGPPTFA